MQAYIADIAQSDVDWDSQPSIIVYFAGCDFRCPYCFASELLDFKEIYLRDMKDIKSVIKSLSHSSGSIFFTGGEPCLQKLSLVELAKFSRQLGLRTGLQTNGSNPKVLGLLLDLNLLNYISLDIKTPFDEAVFEKTTRSRTFFRDTKDILSSVRESFSILKESRNVQIDVRTTIAPGLMFNKEHILRIASELKNMDCRWLFQQFQPNAGRLVNANMKDLNSLSMHFLETLKEYCLKTYPELNIEIKTDGFNVADLAKYAQAL